MDALNKKYECLLTLLREMGSAAVAFSGGVDSTLLLRAAVDALGRDCAAITVRSSFVPAKEAAEAAALSAALGAELITLDADVLSVPGVAQNPPDRCYLCKHALFGAICEQAKARGFRAVVEGSNLDDMGDYRPGMRAVAELGVRSPLKEAALRKAEIRAISARLGLPTAAKPSMACLASRFAAGMEITEEGLRRVEAAEDLLDTLGLSQRRVRVHGDLARIEALPEAFPLLTAHAAEIDAKLRALGFRYVALDLGGYRTGSMNPSAEGKQTPVLPGAEA